MIIILPLGHEDQEAQRYPYITLGFVLLNTALFILTLIVAPASQRAHYEKEYELVEFYIQHLQFEFPENTYNKLLPQYRQVIQHVKKYGLKEVLRQSNIPFEMPDELPSSVPKSKMSEALEARQQEQTQFEFTKRIQAFEHAYANDFYIKYGYVPSRGGILTIFSSMFLHGGWLHLIGNMLFLWLAGCNIEDLWGRILYPIFYLVGGALATVAHGMMFPESMTPLIGASGAIAAVMGAFMIRKYATKIYFVYFIWVVGILRGKFSAPAFIMLPLWLMQQLWGVIFNSGGGGGVAFWAHIGGFAFGALVALLIKVTGFETNVIAPALDRKTSIVEPHLAAGIQKLRDENDAPGAVEELRQAIQAEPENPIAHSELARAYFAVGKKDMAQREFKRGIFLYMKQGDMENAIDQYIELHEEMPEMMLDVPQQKKLAAALEERALCQSKQYTEPHIIDEQEQRYFAYAATAHKQIAGFHQRKNGNFEHPDAIAALTKYAEIQIERLKNPQEAGKAYSALLQNPNLTPENKAALTQQIQRAKEMMQAFAREKAAAQAAEAASPQRAALQRQTNATAQRNALIAKIPMAKRIKLVQNLDMPAKYQVPSIAPLEANKVARLDDGLDFKRPGEPPMRFDEIFAILVFQLPDEKPTIDSGNRRRKKGADVPTAFTSKQEVIFADMFLGGQSRPYRVASNHISYPDFFTNLQANSYANFRQFILYLLSNIASVYVDQYTIDFLKNGKTMRFLSINDLELHEKRIWKQLRGAARAMCEQCAAVYWIDSAKVPAGGGTVKCAACGHPVEIRKPEERD
ncbi:rhomboid family protein [Candidatus Moduliflexus flocculans]|uniref:Rhomboid family protein n=1 Tax=Candidatus Moduliflexus flocculans TaxID=1499966 RepID=A0A081BLU0_9BACT|nr:rhomboid family protein [Candidatus Moduliflexus flocculans]